jgi:hypothetical protein
VDLDRKPFASAQLCIGDMTATLLPDGRVLMLGGSNTSVSTANSNAFFFDEWGEALAGQGPSLTSLTASAPRNTTVTFTGTGFTPRSDASGGSQIGVPTNRPLLFLQRDGNNLQAFAPVMNWSNIQATARIPGDLQPGRYWARVIVNGTPSVALPIVIEQSGIDGGTDAGSEADPGDAGQPEGGGTILPVHVGCSQLPGWSGCSALLLLALLGRRRRSENHRETCGRFS